MQKCVIKEKPILFSTDMVQAIIDWKENSQQFEKKEKVIYSNDLPNGKYIFMVKQPEKKREIDYENKTLKNCAMCKVIAHGAMLLNLYSNFISSFSMQIG